MDMASYDETIKEIVAAATEIPLTKTLSDGRIESAVKEVPFLEGLKALLLERHSEWDVIISPPRAACDLIVNGLRINLKLTDCKTADNSVNKSAIYYSITGDTNYPYSSNWNSFLDKLKEAAVLKKIKKTRDRSTEYHYLVKNKITGAVLLKPIFDIQSYISNPSNDLQINWKSEFASIDCYTPDSRYIEKVESLLKCIQKSVQEMIERTSKFAYAELSDLFKDLEVTELKDAKELTELKEV